MITQLNRRIQEIVIEYYSQRGQPNSTKVSIKRELNSYKKKKEVVQQLNLLQNYIDSLLLEHNKFCVNISGMCPYDEKYDDLNNFIKNTLDENTSLNPFEKLNKNGIGIGAIVIFVAAFIIIPYCRRHGNIAIYKTEFMDDTYNVYIKNKNSEPFAIDSIRILFNQKRLLENLIIPSSTLPVQNEVIRVIVPEFENTVTIYPNEYIQGNQIEQFKIQLINYYDLKMICIVQFIFYLDNGKELSSQSFYDYIGNEYFTVDTTKSFINNLNILMNVLKAKEVKTSNFDKFFINYHKSIGLIKRE